MKSAIPVCRNSGDATPWHLPHPSHLHLTLCGALRGRIKSAIYWGNERELPWQCRRCTRLEAALRG